MLGTFDLSEVGRYVISGDDPEAFIWDLFDQTVLHGPSVGRVGGMRIIVPDRDGITTDAAERQRARGTAAWQEMHSTFLCDCITQGYLIRTHLFPQDMIYELHALRLVSQVQEVTHDTMWHMARMNLMHHRHGKDSPEYRDAVNQVDDPQGYPYEDVTPANLVNFLRLRKMLVLQAADALPSGILPEGEVQRQIAEHQQRRERDKTESMAASDAARRQRRPRTPRKS